MAGVPPPAGGYAWPPGWPEYHAYGTRMAPPRMRPLGGLATAATVLLGVMAAIALFGVAAHLNRVGLVEREFRERSVTLDELEDADNAVAAVALVNAVGLLTTAAVFIAWQYRHAVNADELAGTDAPLGPRWAIGGWFIPCANWLLPAMQLFGASRASDPALPLRPSPGRGRGSPLVVLWAAMFSLGGAVGMVGWGRFPDEDDVSGIADLEGFVSDARLADRMVAAGFVITAAAAVLAAVMVRTLSRRQTDRASAMATAATIGWR